MNWFRKATQAIRRALTGATVTNAPPHTIPPVDPLDKVATESKPPKTSPSIVGIRALETDARPPAAASPFDQAFEAETHPPFIEATAFIESPPFNLQGNPRQAPSPRVEGKNSATVDAGTGEFTRGAHTHLLQTRLYKLYLPPGHRLGALPLIVMLHGCNQDPDDFAVGTRMNEQARKQGFCVLYPEQAKFANASRCWNWFMPRHQQRGSGEPALLASLTQAVIAEHGIDARRVYIAGMSAGGAMAAIVAAVYPEIFSAVAVHSGLPRGAASNVFEALSVMKSGGADPHANTNPVADGFGAVPTIVFHGDLDHTVHPRNGAQVIVAVLGRAALGHAAITGPHEAPALPAESPTVEQGESVRGQHYTRSIHRDPRGNILAEHWQLHGAGHAWSGGNDEGSYTDSNGPDATEEMLRFFFARRAPLAHTAIRIGLNGETPENGL